MGLLDTGSFTPYEATLLLSRYCVAVELCGGEVGYCVVLGRGEVGAKMDD